MKANHLFFILSCISATLVQSCQPKQQIDKPAPTATYPAKTQTHIAVSTWGASYSSTLKAYQTKRVSDHLTETVLAGITRNADMSATAVAPTPTITVTSTQRPTPDLERLEDEYDQAYSETKIYVSNELGISFEYPSVYDETGCTPHFHGVTLYIGARLKLTKYETEAKDYDEFLDEFYKDQFPNVESIEPQKDYGTIGGIRSLSIILRVCEDNGDCYWMDYYMIKQEGYVYVFHMVYRAGCDSRWAMPNDSRLMILVFDTLKFLE